MQIYRNGRFTRLSIHKNVTSKNGIWPTFSFSKLPKSNSKFIINLTKYRIYISYFLI